MDLPSRVKDLFRNPETPEATHGEADRRTPGSFPVDPVDSNESSGPNKLQKRDPRDLTGGESQSHKQTDSGVGLTDSRGYSTQKPEAAGYEPDNLPKTNRDIPVQTHSHSQSQGQGQSQSSTYTGSKTDSHRGTSGFGGGLPSHQTTQRGSATEPFDTSTAAGAAAVGSSQHDTTKDTIRGRDDVAQDHPYWGDIPRGAGVYNSVTGHGSEEDQRKRQQEIYQQESRGTTGQGISSTQGTSGRHPDTVGDITGSGNRGTQQQTYGTTGHSGQTSSSGQHPTTVGDISGSGNYGTQQQQPHGSTGLSSYGTSGYNTSSHGTSGQHPTTVGDIGSSGRSQQQPYVSSGLTDSRHDALRSGEQRETINRQGVLGGTGAATTAAAAAYNLHNRPEGDKSSDRQARDTTYNELAESKQGKHSGGLLHKSDDHHKETKTKSVDDSSHEKKHGLGGIFHRGEKKHDNATSDVKHSDQRDTGRDNSNAAAYTGASGAAAYIANRGHNNDEQHRDQPRDTLNQPLGSTQHQSLGSARDQPFSGQSQHQSPVTTHNQPLSGQSQPLGSQGTTHHDRTVDNRSASGAQYDHLTTGTSSGVRRDPLAQGSSTTSRDNNQHDSHRHNTTAAATAAAAAGAGVGAGAYAHSNRDDKDRDPTDSRYTEGSSNTRGILPTTGGTRDTSAFAGQTGSRDPLSNTTGGLGSTHNTDPTYGTSSSRHIDPSQNSSTSHGSNPSLDSSNTSKDIPALADSANHGQYKTLASGTPSGVNVEDHHSPQQSPLPSGAETRDDSHNTSKYAAPGLGAAGLGAVGAGAYNSRNKEGQMNKLDPVEQQQVRQFERHEGKSRSNPLSGATGTSTGIGSHQSEPVLHRCTECGEDNDITSYVKDLKEKYGRN